LLTTALQRSAEALSVIGGGGREGRTCREGELRKQPDGTAGTRRGTRKRTGSRYARVARYKNRFGPGSGKPAARQVNRGRSLEDGTSRPTVSDLSDRQSVAKLRGVGSRRRPADSAVRKTPGCRVRRAVGRIASKARRRMAPGEQTGAPGRWRREPQRGTLGKQPSDPPGRTELGTGNEALERGERRRWSAAPPTTGGQGPGNRYRSVRGAML
jgi:hypothetical protein